MNSPYCIVESGLRKVLFGCAWALLLWCVAAAANGNPAAVEVTASIEIRGYTYDLRTQLPTATNAYSFSARCIFSPHSWFLENDAPANAVYYHYFDGTNVYETFRPKRRDGSTEAEVREERVPRFAQKWKAGAPASITVIPGAHPMHDMSINVPWMAYCSSAYLRLAGRRLPIPGPFSIRDSLYAFGYEDQTVTFEDELGLPKSIELYTSSKLLKTSPHRASLLRDPAMTAVRAPFTAPVPYRDRELHCPTLSATDWSARKPAGGPWLSERWLRSPSLNRIKEHLSLLICASEVTRRCWMEWSMRSPTRTCPPQMPPG